MARQLPDLNPIASNEVSEQDLMLIRDMSSLVDKKITFSSLVGALASKIASALNLKALAYKDNITSSFITDAYVDTSGQRVLVIGDIQIVSGTTLTANAGTAVTFVKSFASTPNVVATIIDTNNHTAWVSGLTTTAVTLRQLYTAGPLNVSWIAIGKRGTW